MSHKFDISYDVRVLERNLKEGIITEKDYKEFLNKLEDISENAVPIETLPASEEEEDISGEENNESESEEK